MGTDGVFVDAVMVGTWMLSGKGWSLCGRYHGWDMDALSGWTILWLGHGCSVGRDGVWVNVILVGTSMLCENGWGLCVHCHGWDMDAPLSWSLGGCYHGCDMDAPHHDGLWERRLHGMCKKTQGQNTRNRQQHTIKHRIAPSICKKHTRQRPLCVCVCQKHTTTPRKIRRADLLNGFL